MEKLFRLSSLHEGEAFQKEYYTSIENLALGTSINPNSTFTVNIRQWATNAIVETYSNLDMNPVSENYILKRIGDMDMQWDATDLKFNMVNVEFGLIEVPNARFSIDV